MSYNGEMKAAGPAANTYYGQQAANPSNLPSYNAGAAGPQPTQWQSPPQPQGSPYPAPSAAGTQPTEWKSPPQQQGSPYPAPPGGQYPQGYPQTVVVHHTAQPQVQAAQPQVLVVSGTGCAQGQHYFTNHYGTCGIIAAILLFPIGLIFLFVDQERRCDRCGIRV
ncbi:hypothetical protein JB92DRAFT_3138849 [Gautieria morchelliformis]|nr:hypothetical protein JB92DRAFT_3138849 [Gautieria morchelliformis]